MNNFFYQILKKASDMIYSDEFKKRNITNEKSFIRNRKLTFPIVVSMILNMMTKTAQIEVDNFFEIVLENEKSITKQAFFKARKNISPEAFKELFRMTNDIIIQKNKIRRYKGYRIFAVDGSELRIEKNKSTEKYFRQRANSAENKTSARISVLYDVISDFVLDAQIGSLETDEREMAVSNISCFSGYFNSKDIVVFDRGYPSRKMISFMTEMNCKYLMRLQGSCFRGVKENSGNDFRITITHNDKIYSVRVVRVVLKSGEVETLITNLSENELDTDKFRKLYFLRWGIETAFDTLKNKFLIEKFSGKSLVAVFQEYYSVMFLMNCMSAMKLTVDRKLKKSKKHCRYLYEGNRSLIVGCFKHRIPAIILYPHKRIELCQKLLLLCIRQPVPVIPDRFFQRPLFSHQRKVFSPKFSI